MKKGDHVLGVVVDQDHILFVDEGHIPGLEIMKILMKLNLKAKEVIQEVIDTATIVAQDLAVHVTEDTLAVEAAAVPTHPGVHILLNIVPATLIMMIAITDMVERGVDIHLDTIDHLCLAAGDILETGIILNPVGV